MIPSTNDILSTSLKVERQPSKNHKLHIDYNTIGGYCDGLEAMKQVVYKILNTERYEHIIYSWNYGVELRDLFGEPVNYVISEIERRIKEALLQDDRITKVNEFEFEVVRRGVVHTKFTVHTIFGDIQEEKVVNY